MLSNLKLIKLAFSKGFSPKNRAEALTKNLYPTQSLKTPTITALSKNCLIPNK